MRGPDLEFGTPVEAGKAAAEGADTGSQVAKAISGEAPAAARKKPAALPVRDRSLSATIWYQTVRYFCAILATVLLRWRATGQRNVPVSGGVLLVCNHVSYFDVVFLGIPLSARLIMSRGRRSSYLFWDGSYARWGPSRFQREGIGASGMKETLRRLRSGGIVTLFPEGTRSADGQLGALKPGIAVLVERVGVPVVPAGVAGAFEIWPRSRLIPVPHPIRVHYGQPIFPAELEGLDTQAVTALIRTRMEESYLAAHRGLQRDLNY